MFIRYRKIGNCFINCFIYGCNLFRENINALDVFNIETLYGLPDKEFEPALNFLVSKSYEIKIYDPEPTNWGVNIKLANWLKKTYTIRDVDDLVSNNWCIIPCSLDLNNQPIHAVLIYKTELRDPVNKDKWQLAQKTKVFKKKYFPKNESKRFLLAFRK